MNLFNYTEYRDLLYETENIGYDCNYPDGGIKCRNYDLCKYILSPDNFESFQTYLCGQCNYWFKPDEYGCNKLQFRESEEECAVCTETGIKQVKFPANCGHWFCVSCSSNILFWDETRYHLQMSQFGCPPCPNGCINPIKGKQCYCDDYYNIINKWKDDEPSSFKIWYDAEETSVRLSETTPGSVFHSLKCPLCRKKYDRNTLY